MIVKEKIIVSYQSFSRPEVWGRASR